MERERKRGKKFNDNDDGRIKYIGLDNYGPSMYSFMVSIFSLQK